MCSACPAPPDHQVSQHAPTQTSQTASHKGPSGRSSVEHKPRFVSIPKDTSNVWGFVKTLASTSKQAGRKTIVYVGARWCKPCKHFVNTVNSGKLDPLLRNITFLKFDYDDDHDALKEGGYLDKFVPIFVVPGPEGRASKNRFSGTASGTKSLDSIVTRLKDLLQSSGSP
jgi:thiol-disulfide isomerase/thioredoxin